MPGGMASSRETHVFGVGVMQGLRTPPKTICSIGAKHLQGPSRVLGTLELSPIPCSSLAQGELGAAAFSLIRE